MDASGGPGGDWAELNEALPAHAPWEETATDLPPGGPARVWRGRGAVAWVVSPGRAAAEREGYARLRGHPALPARIETAPGSRILAFEPFSEPPEDLVSVVSSWPGEPAHLEGSRRELLAAIEDEVNVPRALSRMTGPDGRRLLRRRDLDRWLAGHVRLETVVGPSFGGARPGWFRLQGERTVCLRCDRARERGWRAVDLAGLALGGEPVGAPELARVAVWARELLRSRDPGLAEELASLIAPSVEPDRVRVWIEGPDFVDPRLWNAPGEEVSASRARWLLANVNGLAVGGGRIEVRTEPPIRAGRRAPPREDRAARRRRLFARWDEGVQVDDEGLVGATPEALARRIARGARGVVVDGTTGVGSLAIAYAREPNVTKVIAVDRDARRLTMARHNAALYGVEAKIEFRRGDIVALAGALRADLLVLDPPWGGRGYDRARVTLDELGFDVRAALARFSGPVVLKLPRSFDVATLPGGGWTLEPIVDARGILKMLLAHRA